MFEIRTWKKRKETFSFLSTWLLKINTMTLKIITLARDFQNLSKKNLNLINWPVVLSHQLFFQFTVYGKLFHLLEWWENRLRKRIKKKNTELIIEYYYATFMPVYACMGMREKEEQNGIRERMWGMMEKKNCMCNQSQLIWNSGSYISHLGQERK